MRNVIQLPVTATIEAAGTRLETLWRLCDNATEEGQRITLDDEAREWISKLRAVQYACRVNAWSDDLNESHAERDGMDDINGDVLSAMTAETLAKRYESLRRAIGRRMNRDRHAV